jgi:hypothetical protein
MRALSAFSLCAPLVLAAKRGDEEAGQCTVRTVTYLAPYTSPAGSYETGGYTAPGHGADDPHATDGPYPGGSYPDGGSGPDGSDPDGSNPDDGSNPVGGFYSTGIVDPNQGNGYQIDTSEIYETATSYWSYPTEIETVLPITTQVYSTYSSFEPTVITTTVVSTTEVPTTITIDNTATVTSVLTSVVTSVSTFSTSFPVTFSVTLTTTDTISTVLTSLVTTSSIVTSTATSEITVSGPTVTEPGTTVTGPGLTVTGPGFTITGPGLTITGPTITGPTITGPTITGPGITVTLPGITGPTITVIPTGLPFLEIISVRINPAATPAPVVKKWLPRFKRQATEQLPPQGYFGTPDDLAPQTCDRAVQVEFDEGRVIANGRLIATQPDLPFLDLTLLTEGSIQTNFSIQNDLVVWANDAFFGGLARFCQVLDGRIFGLFEDTTGPADCTLVDLVVYSCELLPQPIVDEQSLTSRA